MAHQTTFQNFLPEDVAANPIVDDVARFGNTESFFGGAPVGGAPVQTRS